MPAIISASRLIRVAVIVLLLALTGLGPTARAQAAAATPITPGVAFGVQLRDEIGFTDAAYTFTGTAGQRVVLTQTGQFPVDGVLYQLTSAGETLAPAIVRSFGEVGVLPSSGTWTLTARNTSDIPTDAQATLTLVTDTTLKLTFGSAQVASLTVPGQNQNLTFNGTVGGKVGVSVASTALTGLNPGVDFRLVRPDGSQLDAFRTVTGPDFLSAVLDVSGAWTLQVDPRYDTTGSITFTATRPVDKIINVTPGTATPITLAGGGRDVRLRFPASAGQRITLPVTRAALTSQFGQVTEAFVHATLIGPDGTELSALTDVTKPVFAEQSGTLPSSGTWTVLLHGAGDTVGSLTVAVGVVTDRTIATVLGRSNAVAVATPGQNVAYTFPATAGQHLIATLTGQSWSAGGAGGDPLLAGARVTLLDPSGQFMENLIDGTEFGERLSLPQDGTYTMLVDPLGDSVGSATLTIRLPKVTTSALTVGRSTTATIARGDVRRYTFNGSPGQHGVIQVTAATWSSAGTPDVATFTVHRPDGSVFYTQNVSGTAFLDPDLLDAQGTWTLDIDPADASAGSIAFTVQPITDVRGTLAYGQQVTSTLKTPGQTARYTFTAKAGDRVAVDTAKQAWSSADGTTSEAIVQLIGPDGTKLNLGSGVPYPAPNSPTTWASAGPDGLSTSGTWTLVIDPIADYVGSKTFALRKLTTVKGGALTLGKPVQVTIPSKGAWAEYSFTLAPNDIGIETFDWTVTGSTISQGGLSLVRPDRLTLSEDTFGTGTASGTLQVVSEPAETVTLRVRAGFGEVGTATVTLTQRPL